MENEWFDLAYINFDNIILHGRIRDGQDEFGVNNERRIEQVPTDAQNNSS